MTKTELAEKIKRRFGYPVVKVELDADHYTDAIDYARNKFIKWAVGQATVETYFTIALSAGEYLYDMPVGVTEVINYSHGGSGSGINQLFTVDNFLYNQGMYDSLLSTSGNGYNLISYHIARDFLELVDRYVVDKYNFKYHPYTNELELRPTPTVSSGTSSSASLGYILIRSYMIEGSTTSDDWESGDTDTSFYEHSDWIFDYATAYCKITLGRIRSKFAQFASLGNVGISLDGDNLITEGKEEMERLEEKLQLEETYTGLGIIIG